MIQLSTALQLAALHLINSHGSDVIWVPSTTWWDLCATGWSVNDSNNVATIVLFTSKLANYGLCASWYVYEP